MKGIILAGGTGSRLYPISKVTNKHLLPIHKKPMIFYPIEKLTECGIFEILIVTGTEHMGSVIQLLGSGRNFGCNFTYRVQDEAGGIAQALLLAENFAGGDKIAVILGDNIFEESINSFVENFKLQKDGAKILLKEVHDPERYGVAEIKDQKIISIEEKPLKPKSNFSVTGIYMYDSNIFEIIRTLKPSKRGELEITDVNNKYVANGKMTYDFLKGFWTDAGTFESLEHANLLVRQMERQK
jgi:glucose-1-phosphate thymidylyltransferase